jgi:hypothetical protein
MQSFAKQPSYSTYAKYSQVGTSKVRLLLPAQKNLSAAMKAFAEFFKEKTGKEWQTRADGKMPPAKCNEDGEPLPPHEGWYTMEIRGNLFTDYLKSYREPSDLKSFEVQEKVNPLPEQPTSTSAEKSLDTEGLSEGHALLESLILMEFGSSIRDEPEGKSTVKGSSQIVADEVVEKPR